MSRPVDVLISGAGPAGSVTAALLARRGWTVRLVERASLPRPKPCAEYLSPDAVAVLEELGLGARVETLEPVHLHGIRITGPGGASFEGRFARNATGTPARPHGLGLPRGTLDHCLAEAAAAAGATLEDGTTVEACAADGAAGYRVTLRHHRRTSSVRTRLLIGADGLNSRVAASLGVQRRGRRHRLALVAHLRNVAGMGDVGEMFVGPTGYIGLAPVAPGVTNAACVVDLTRATPVRPLAAWFRARLAADPSVHRRTAGAALLSPVRAVGPFDRRTSRASADAALLVGDAAGFCDPFTGQGIHTALLGARLAAAAADAALEHGNLSRTALAGYDHQRRRAFGGRWRFERLVAALVASPAWFTRLSAWLARRPDLADLLVGMSGGGVPPAALLRPTLLLAPSRRGTSCPSPESNRRCFADSCRTSPAASPWSPPSTPAGGRSG